MKQHILTNKWIPGGQVGSTEGFITIGHGIEIALPQGAKNGDQWEIEVSPLTTKNYLASTVLGSDVFVSNPDTLLSLIRGNLLQTGNDPAGTFDFRGKSNIVPNFRSDKIATYFNHIFLAIGRTVWWTDLDNFWNWYPAVESEADFRTIEWEKENITALTVLNDVLFIHFPTCIYECVYVGKPTIVRILKRVTGAGSINSRCVQTTKNCMFFMGTDNFYMWSVDIGLKEIGQEVWRKFHKEHPHPENTWSYHDLRNQEICFVNDNRTWAFNYVEGHWTKYSADGIRAHCTAPWHSDFSAVSCGESNSIIESDKWKGIENLWVGCWGVAREARLDDPLAKRLPMETPFLQTDDLTYGDIHSMKSMDLVVLDADMKHPWTGIRVKASGKNRVTEQPNWTDCGVWRTDKVHQDFPAVSGKALQLRFELVDDIVQADGSVVANGGQQLNGKRVDNYDGSIIMDGTRTLHAPADYVDNSQGEKWAAELYAWGERANLPEKLVGPDK